MATIIKVSRKSHDAYKAVIRLRGVKPVSKTFRLKKDAKAWAIRMERNIDEARANGNQKLLLHEQAVSDNSPCATGSQEFGDRGQ
jgi:hypothetical protein